MNEELTHRSSRARVLPATGRIGIVRAYFDIYAVLGGALTVGGIVVTVWPARFGPVTLPSHPWLSIAAAAMLTWGSYQTSRMLGRRQRSGAWAASLTFVGGLFAVGPSVSTVSLGLSLVGLGLVASIWRHLD